MIDWLTKQISKHEWLDSNNNNNNKEGVKKAKQQLEEQQLTRENTNDYIRKNPLYWWLLASEITQRFIIL